MLFTGKVLSEDIGLIYFGVRWYDPEVGRFITVDPADDGGNWYEYCGNDPINYVDPEGEFRNASQALWLLTGPILYIWDTLKGLANLASFLMPYPCLPIQINAVIVGCGIAYSVYQDPTTIINLVKGIGYGLVSDIVDTVKTFQMLSLEVQQMKR
jgi:RHS repeat-associated protein